SKPARTLAALGAEVVQGDMGETASLRPIFAGAYGAYSVQNPFINGPEAEIRQGNTSPAAGESSKTALRIRFYPSRCVLSCH
ncbi:MAG TPA: NmrA family NAD(P)-binding protein, partial [Roseiflexaceae bacterium]|nr:NmrA family NAD(P)-binding protein [Roseiflexaceae bacterium]